LCECFYGQPLNRYCMKFVQMYSKSIFVRFCVPAIIRADLLSKGKRTVVLIGYNDLG